MSAIDTLTAEQRATLEPLIANAAAACTRFARSFAGVVKGTKKAIREYETARRRALRSGLALDAAVKALAKVAT